MNITSHIEAYLFVSPDARAENQIARAVGQPIAHVRTALAELEQEYSGVTRGIQLLHHNDQWQFVTAPACADTVRAASRVETDSELSRPSLEALSIIAYRGPVSRAEIEYIRGVQSSLILRNLLIRGLIEASGEEEDARYQASPLFLRSVGITKITDLPNYSDVHGKPLEELL